MSITFETPAAGLLAFLVVAPVIAFVVSAVVTARGRALLHLPPPTSDRQIALSALVAIPMLLGLAAAGPALREHSGRHIRTDAQAIFVFDTSRSMAASAARGAPTRFAQARAAAIELRNTVIPDVPSGVASLTTQLLPHLFPTSNEAAFNSTVTDAIGIERPPPPAVELGLTGTSFRPLSGLRDQGYFDSTAAHRFVILLTDGESAQFDPEVLAQSLTQNNVRSQTNTGFPGAGQAAPHGEPAITLFIVRIGSASDRIYYSDGSTEVAYRPDPRAAAIVDTFAADLHQPAFTSARLPTVGAALRKAVGSGNSTLEGVNKKTVALAPYAVLAAFLPLFLLLRRRNLTAI